MAEGCAGCGDAVGRGDHAGLVQFHQRVAAAEELDTFDDEAGRTAHLEGPIAAALMEVAGTMLADAPDIRPIDLLAAKSV